MTRRKIALETFANGWRSYIAMLTALTHTARRRALSLGLAALVTVTFAGCGSIITPYQPFGFQYNFGIFAPDGAGGYFETELADDQYAVCFEGFAGQTPMKGTLADDKNVVRLRAAEITLEQNYTHFVIESDKTSEVYVDQVCNERGSCYEDEPVYQQPLVTLHIKLLKSPGSSVPGAIDAKSLYDSLAPKYKKPLSHYQGYWPGFECGEDVVHTSINPTFPILPAWKRWAPGGE